MARTRLEVSDLDILAAAQEKAFRILSDARRQVEATKAAGRSEAAELLLRQQKKAEELLSAQRAEASKKGEESAEAVARAPYENKAEIAANAADLADALLRRQAAAAEALRASEETVALKTHDAVEAEAVVTIMAAHREAAAVLLQAKMVVEERRSAADRGQQPG